MYDTTECLEESNQTVSPERSENDRRCTITNKCREQSQDHVDHGIELQVLNGIIEYNTFLIFHVVLCKFVVCILFLYVKYIKQRIRY